MASNETSSSCFVAHSDTVLARNEGRPKRPREQVVDSGMEVENQANSNAQQHLSSNGDSGDHKMEVESQSSGASNGDQSSGQSQKRSHKSQSSPKQVTDDSCESEDTEKGKSLDDGCSTQEHDIVRRPQHQQEDGVTAIGQQASKAGETTNGFHQESDQQSSASTDVKPSLPQHERIHEVNPPDISYRSTPASLKLRESLLSRLQLIAPTGRIQVVSRSLC